MPAVARASPGTALEGAGQGRGQYTFRANWCGEKRCKLDAWRVALRVEGSMPHSKMTIDPLILETHCSEATGGTAGGLSRLPSLFHSWAVGSWKVAFTLFARTAVWPRFPTTSYGWK